MPRKNQAASAKRRVARIHSASTRRAISAPTANANGTANSVYPEYSIGGWIIMLGWRSSGLRPVPSAGATGERVERRRREDEQRGEERAEAEQHGGRVRRDVAQPPAREEQHEARPQRQQPHPQQQRALLRGPRGGGLVEGRRRRRRVRRDDREREVRAQERDLEHHEGDGRQRRRARRPRGGPRPTHSRAAACARRRATRRCRRARRRARGSGRRGRRWPSAGLGASCSSVNFDGHFVTSESRSPTNVAPCLRDLDDDLAALAERVGHRARVADRAPRPCPRGRARGRSARRPSRRIEPSTTLPVELVASCRPWPRRRSWLGVTASAGGAEARVDERAGQQEAAVRATTSRMLRLRAGSMRVPVSQTVSGAPLRGRVPRTWI